MRCLWGLAIAGALAAPAQAQLLPHRDLSLATAKTIAETALESCTAKGYAVSVVVEHGNAGAQMAGPIARDIMTDVLNRDPAAPRDTPQRVADGAAPA